MEEGRIKLKKLVKEIEKVRGRHTELVTVYIPQGCNLSDVINQLKQEQGTAINIKSKSTRKNVLDALEKAVQHLKLYKNTPEHGLAVFSGNISEKEGVTDIKVWAIEPPDPIKVKLYWCDQIFRLEPLIEQLKEKEVFGLLVLDNQEATLGMLRGKAIHILRRMHSIVPGKQKHGGQSAARFGRVREGLKNDWYKKIAENVVELFGEEVKGIIIGGPGPVKNTFFDEDHLSFDMKKRVLGIKDTGYTDEFGLQELVNRSKDLLAGAAVAKETDLIQKFFSELQKDSGKVTYGLQQVLKVLEAGAVEILLVSEEIEWNEIEYLCRCGKAFKKFVKTDQEKGLICTDCGQPMGIVGEMDGLDAFEALVKKYGTQMEIISKDTSEGEQFFQLGGIGAFLRWKQ